MKLIHTYNLWDNLIDNYGNNTYEVINIWDPIIQGLMLCDHDLLDISREFRSHLIKNQDSQFKPNVESMVNYITEIELNIYKLEELHGIYRYWGHPTVDETAGYLKVPNIVKRRIFPNYKMMYKL